MHCKQVWKDGGAVWKLTGNLKYDDLMRLILARNAHCRFRKAEYMIHDFLGVTGIELSEDELGTIADHDKESMGLAPNLRMAFVVTKESYIKRIEQFIEKMKGSSWQIKIFESFDAAYEWAVRERWEAVLKPSAS